MKSLARLGCLSRSFVYFAVGLLALLAALGSPKGETTDTRGLMLVISKGPYGTVTLMILAIGLLAYAIWRFFQSVQDHDKYGKTISGRIIRSAFFLSGLVHIFLAAYALNLIFAFTKHTRLGERMMARWMLMQPHGRYALEVMGLIIVIIGGVQFWRAFATTFTRDLVLPKSKTLLWVCKFGLIARGIVFVIIGSFFFQAGWKYRSREAGGLTKAFETLNSQPYGGLLLGTVAVGFMAFAIFGCIEGFYRRERLQGRPSPVSGRES